MITRRNLLITSAAAATSISAPAIRSARAADRPLTVVHWGGAAGDMFKKVFFEPFSKIANIKVLDVAPISYPKVLSMVQANAVEWDVIIAGGSFAYRSPEALEPIDFSIVDKTGLSSDWIRDNSLFTHSGGTVLSYNNKTFPEGRRPQSWQDFWNLKDFPGPRGLYYTFQDNYEIALLAAGIPKSEIYPVTDEKVQKALAKLKEIRSAVLVWWKSGAQPPQLLSTGELAMSSAWSGRVIEGIKQNAPLGMTWNQALIWADCMNVIKGTPHKKEAMQLVGYSVSQKAQDDILGFEIYAPTRPSSVAKARPEQKPFLSTAHLDQGLIVNYQQLAFYLDKYSDQWEKFMLG